jgi:hypothetical protein
MVLSRPFSLSTLITWSPELIAIRYLTNYVIPLMFEPSA